MADSIKHIEIIPNNNHVIVVVALDPPLEGTNLTELSVRVDGEWVASPEQLAQVQARVTAHRKLERATLLTYVDEWIRKDLLRDAGRFVRRVIRFWFKTVRSNPSITLSSLSAATSVEFPTPAIDTTVLWNRVVFWLEGTRITTKTGIAAFKDFVALVVSEGGPWDGD